MFKTLGGSARYLHCRNCTPSLTYNIVLLNQPIHVNICEALSSIRAPVPQQSPLDMLVCQALAKQRVLFEVDHAQAQVQSRMEVVSHLADLIVAEDCLVDSRARSTEWRDAERAEILAGFLDGGHDC